MSLVEAEMRSSGQATGQAVLMGSRLAPDEEYDEFEDEPPVAMTRDALGGGKKMASAATKVKKRRVTDSFCMFILILYAIVMLAILHHGYSAGNPEKLFRGYNYKGQTCGVETEVQEKDFTFWCAKKDFTGKDGKKVPWKLLDPICVEKCPDGSGENLCPGELELSGWSQTDGTEAGSKIDTQTITREMSIVKDYETKPAFTYYCLPKGHNMENLVDGIFGSGTLNNGFKSAMFFIEAVDEAKWFLAGFVVMAIALGYGYLFLMASFIRIIILSTFAVVDLSLFILGLYGTLIATGADKGGIVAKNDFLTPVFGEEGGKKAAIILGGVCWILFLLFSIYWCLAVTAIDRTVKAVQDTFQIVKLMPTILMAPAFSIVFQLSTFFFFAGGSVAILSLGKVKTSNYLAEMLLDPEAQSTVQGVYREFEFTSAQWVMIFVWGFGCMWFFEMCKAWNQFAVANAVVELKITNTSSCTPVSKGYWKGARYHLGTIAFGAFIMGLVDMCSFIVELMLKQMKDKDGKLNKTIKAMECICACFFKCLKEIVSCTNQLVYADCVMQGHSFLQATKNVMLSYLSNPVTMATVMGTTKYLKMAGTVLITVTGTLIAYVLTKTFHAGFQFDEKASLEGVEDPGILDFAKGASSSPYAATVLGVTASGFVISVSVAQSFMTTFDMLTDTVNYCNIQMEDAKKSQGGYQKF